MHTYTRADMHLFIYFHIFNAATQSTFNKLFTFAPNSKEMLLPTDTHMQPKHFACHMQRLVFVYIGCTQFTFAFPPHRLSDCPTASITVGYMPRCIACGINRLGATACPPTTCSAINAYWWHARVSHAHSCGKFVLSLFCMQISNFFLRSFAVALLFCSPGRLQASVCCNLKMSSGFLGARHPMAGDSGDGGSATSGYLMRATIAPMVLLIARNASFTCVCVCVCGGFLHNRQIIVGVARKCSGWVASGAFYVVVVVGQKFTFNKRKWQECIACFAFK